MPGAKPNDSVQAVVGELQKVRAEHDALLKTILADSGMEVQTRQVLLTHLRDGTQLFSVSELPHQGQRRL